MLLLSLLVSTGGTDCRDVGRFRLDEVALFRSADELSDDIADIGRLFGLLTGCILLPLSDSTLSSSLSLSTIISTSALSFFSFSGSAEHQYNRMNIIYDVQKREMDIDMLVFNFRK